MQDQRNPSYLCIETSQPRLPDLDGRPLGSKNKFTTLKNAFIETFEELGGVDNLVEWARANQTEFYRMVARLMPREVEAKVSTEFTLVDALMEVEDYVKNEGDAT